MAFARPQPVLSAVPARDPAGLAAGWALIAEAGAAIAGLAALDPATEPLSPQSFARQAAAAGPARLALAERRLDDLAAVLHAGLAALAAAAAAGRDGSVAALTLWREYAAARAALVALVTPAR